MVVIDDLSLCVTASEDFSVKAMRGDAYETWPTEFLVDVDSNFLMVRWFI